MAIKSISRDLNTNVSFVRLISTDNLATISQENYILLNQSDINDLNNGPFHWHTSDMLLVSASDGNALFQFTDEKFHSLEIYGEQGSGVIISGLTNQLPYYAAPGSTLSALDTINDGVMVTDKNGKPKISTIIPSGVQENINTVGTLKKGTWNADVIMPVFGGTGNSEFTPYSIICGGKNKNESLQSIDNLGQEDDLLTSNGPNKFPSFKKCTSFGFVNEGKLNSIAYYSSSPTGKTLSELNSVENSILITNGMGVPFFSNSLPENLEIPGYVKLSDLNNLINEIIKSKNF